MKVLIVRPQWIVSTEYIIYCRKNIQLNNMFTVTVLHTLQFRSSI